MTRTLLVQPITDDISSMECFLTEDNKVTIFYFKTKQCSLRQLQGSGPLFVRKNRFSDQLKFCEGETSAPV